MSLENLSIVLVYGAMAAYTVAMLGFAIDLFGLGSRTVAHKRRAAGIGMSTTWLAAVLHLGALITRTMAAGRVPWRTCTSSPDVHVLRRRDLPRPELRARHALLGSLVNLLIVLGSARDPVLYVNAEGGGAEPTTTGSSSTCRWHNPTALLYIGAAFAISTLPTRRGEEERGAAPQQVVNLRSRKQSS